MMLVWFGSEVPLPDRQAIMQRTSGPPPEHDPIRFILGGGPIHGRERHSEAGSSIGRDAAAIRKLTRQAYAKWVPVIGREPKPMTADYTEAVKKHRFDFLYENGELAALIETVGCSDHLLIENVAVSPSFQGKGYVRMLMAHAEKLAASSNFEQVKPYTNKLFVENVQLYIRLGYSVDREE